VNIHEIFKLIAPDMAAVNACFDQYMSSRIDVVNRLTGYVGSQSGKRLRPALLLLAGRMMGGSSDGLPPLGALVEVIHTASLVQDASIAGAETRRGQPAVNVAFGNHMSVLLGDWLYMTAFQLAVDQRHFGILDLLMDVSRRMVEGELIQLEQIGKVDVRPELSLEIAARKTAHLFSAACALPALASHQPPEIVQRMTAIGLNLGMAFQLVDDALDFTGDAKQFGKPVMGDLREGKVTLPVIYLLQGGDPDHRRMVETILAEKDFRTFSTSDLLEALCRHGCLERTEEAARNFVQLAREDVLTFDPSPYREAFLTIADFILDRRY